MIALAVVLGLALQPAMASALTREEERELGREVLFMVKKNYKMVDDPDIVNYVNQVGRRIVAVIGPQPFDYQFFVLDSDVINAFATPAGNVFINSGLLSNLDNEGELAAILAHEISHVTSRHIAGRMDRSKNLSLATLGGIMAGIFLGGPIGTAMMVGSAAGAVQAELAYTRADEKEADSKGLDYLVEAGYDPRFMAQSFQMLLRTSWHEPDDMPTYLTTHPGLDQRIAAVENAVISHPGYNKVRGQGDTKGFEATKIRILALLADSQRARNYMEGLLKKDPASPMAHYGMGLLFQREQNFSEALREFNTALKADPANPAVLTAVGGLRYRMKDLDGAADILGRVLVLRPDSARALMLMAQINEAQGNQDRARDLFGRVLKQDPDNAEALYKMGQIYGKEGDMARAHLHTGLYFKAEFEYAKAAYHLEKAKEFADKSGPASLKEQIDAALEEVKASSKLGGQQAGGGPGGRR